MGYQFWNIFVGNEQRCTFYKGDRYSYFEVRIWLLLSIRSISNKQLNQELGTINQQLPTTNNRQVT